MHSSRSSASDREILDRLQAHRLVEEHEQVHMMASHGVRRTSSGAQPQPKDPALLAAQVRDYTKLEAEITEKMANGEYNDATLALISRLLVKNPEYYTLWNHRRRILSSSHFSIQMKPLLPPHTGADGSEASAVSTTPLDTGTPPNNEQQATVDLRLTPILSSELKSLLPLLRSFPKCYWIWEYRKWLLTQSQTLLSPAAANVFWQGDLSLVSKLLAADGRNFHAWEYRRFIVDSIEALRLAADPDKSRDAELRKLRCETEIAYTTQMIKKDLSNCSAWHYRSVLLPQMFLVFRTKGPSRNAYFEEELTLITKALYTDPYDQALWFYFNLVVSSNLSTEGASRTSISARGPSVSGLQRLLLILEGLQELLEDAADCKWLLEALVHHSMVALRIDSLITDEQKTEGPIEYSGMMHPIDRVGLMRTIEGWIGELHKLDPLRTNRWSHLGRRLAEIRANDEID